MKPQYSKKKIVARETAYSLLALVRMGKARVVKEFVHGDPVISVVSASGLHIGVIGSRYQYMFENALLDQGSGDGLFDGFDQTTSKS